MVVHDQAAIVNLRDLVENEINLAFTFWKTARITGSKEHRTQALLNATTAYESAERFMHKLPIDALNPSWETRLAELRKRLYPGRIKDPGTTIESA